MAARLADSSVSIAAKGSRTGPGVAEAAEHLAIVVDDVVDSQANQAGVREPVKARRYSDDHHIVRELGEPAAGPGRNIPSPVAGASQIPASEHPGRARRPLTRARAGLRAAEPRLLRPEAHSPRPGPGPPRAIERGNGFADIVVTFDSSSGPAPAGPGPARPRSTARPV
jgi:hypothetical protein